MTLKIALDGLYVPGSRALVSEYSRSALERRTLRAIIGGVAITDPGSAVRKKDAKRADLIAPKINDGELKKLFDAVDQAAEDPKSVPKLMDVDRTAARISGADPGHVAAVRAVVAKDPAALKAGLDWAASLDVERLAAVGEQTNTEVQLGRIPTVEKKQDDLKAEVDLLAKELKELKADVTKLKVQNSPSSGAQKASSSPAKKGA